MSWNPFKRKEEAAPEGSPPDAAAGPEAVSQESAQAQAAPQSPVEDRTDPLGEEAALREKSELLAEGNGLRIERVELWDNGRLHDSFLRLTAAREAAQAVQLKQLLMEADEAASGFRDLLFSNDAALAASLENPLGTLAQLPAVLSDGGLSARPIDLLQGLGAIAALLEQAARGGLAPVALSDTSIGFSQGGHNLPAGQQRLNFMFLGWEQLMPAAADSTQAAALVRLFLPALRELREQASHNGFSFGSTEMTRLASLLESLAQQPALSFGTVADALAAVHCELRSEALTDKGMKRQHNEDAYALLRLEQHSSIGSDLSLFAVADGMGGHASGEVASSLALDLLRQQLMLGMLAPRSTPRDPQQLALQLKQIVLSIDQALSERAQMDSALAGMGTTLCGYAALRPLSTITDGAQQADGSSVVFWVGDSRAYLLGPCGLSQISRDHSFVQDLVESGSITQEQAFSHQNKNIITRCLGGGGGSDGAPDIAHFRPGPGEIILLCSDGLNDALRDHEIWKVVCEHGSDTLPELAHALVSAANAAGGPDNITVILLACSLAG